MKTFSGVGVALITPFNKDGSVDYDSLKRLVLHQINNGTNYLVVQGTTGESATLSAQEKKEVLSFIIKINDGKLPIVLGVGGNDTNEICNKLSSNDLAGVDGILSVSPYYNKPSQKGIIAHFKKIASSTKLPIILYNVPGRTSSNMTAQTSLELASSVKNIVAIKEASGNLEQVMTIINNKPKDFLVLSGDDALTLAHIAVGGDGVISVVANAFPKQFSTLVSSALKGKIDIAKENHYLLFELIKSLFEDGNPGGVKKVLSVLGICNDYLRLPLVNINNELANKLNLLTKKILEKSI